MNNEEKLSELLNLIGKIYNQGELEPFIAFVQTETRILFMLTSADRVHPSDISENLHISRPSVTANLKSLENKKFITRKINPDNRREIFVTVTNSGRDYFSQNISHLIKMFESWMQILGDDYTNTLLEILRLSSDPTKVNWDFLKSR